LIYDIYDCRMVWYRLVCIFVNFKRSFRLRAFRVSGWLSLRVPSSSRLWVALSAEKTVWLRISVMICHYWLPGYVLVPYFIFYISFSSSYVFYFSKNHLLCIYLIWLFDSITGLTLISLAVHLTEDVSDCYMIIT